MPLWGKNILGRGNSRCSKAQGKWERRGQFSNSSLLAPHETDRIVPALSSEGNPGLLAGTHSPLWSTLCDAMLTGCARPLEHPLQAGPSPHLPGVHQLLTFTAQQILQRHWRVKRNEPSEPAAAF